ncbi:spermine synthase [Marilutibacter chinensis]|nr:spermine synthase [Lysobacter chinensis]
MHTAGAGAGVGAGRGVAPVLPVALLLFVLSGFSGLIYQSVWSQYLGLVLGHAAHAQTLVLAIYMGGMAVGAWIASRRGVRWKRLIACYAVVEAAIGLAGILFHPVFHAYTGFVRDQLLPWLPGSGAAHLLQWSSAAALILPQSVMLGATFPLLSAGLIRARPERKGEVLGGLYFANSLGAALGALASTFLMLPTMGLPGTVAAAGVLNILVAVLAWGLGKQADRPAMEAAPADAAKRGPGVAGPVVADRFLLRALTFGAMASGAASFVYEIGWVRMLNLVLGTTVHSFELMLAAFILGLACGSLWIRKRADRIASPLTYLGHAQVLMGIAALLSLPVFARSFEWMEWIMDALQRSWNGYALFELASASIAMLVMFPAAFFAGMTLPLFTLVLLRNGAGEGVIGRIYAANTLGAIIGVAGMVHVAIPLLGVRGAVVAAALIDIAIGIGLFALAQRSRVSGAGGHAATGSRRGMAAAVAVAAAALFTGIVYGRPDPVAQASGVFRTGAIFTDSPRVEFIEDGKTSTITVLAGDTNRIISTNGKPDAAIRIREVEPGDDEHTMVLTGLLPLVYHPEPRQIGIIGWGSGMTTHTVLGSRVPREVDTIEIEPKMVEAARTFGPQVARAYEDPRSRLWIDDARTFFARNGKQYDVIVSEPSNPWVSGVASLFTREFYAFVKRHLKEEGVLVQWLHSYETSDALMATMLAALVEEFPQIDIYVSNTTDLVMVARADGEPLRARWNNLDGAIRAELERVGLDSPEQLRLRRIGGADLIHAYVEMTGVAPHSDYYPTVSHLGPIARYMDGEADLLLRMATNGMPVLDVLECRRPIGLAPGLQPVPGVWTSEWHGVAAASVRTMTAGRLDPWLAGHEPYLARALPALLLTSQHLGGNPALLQTWSEGVASLAKGTIGHLPAEDLAAVWAQPQWLPADAAAMPGVTSIMAGYRAAAQRDPEAMRAHALEVLELPAASVAGDVRDQMLLIAMLGEIGAGRPQAVAELDRRWAPTLGDRPELAPVRRFVRAWVDAGLASGCTPHAGDVPVPATAGGESGTIRAD